MKTCAEVFENLGNPWISEQDRAEMVRPLSIADIDPKAKPKFATPKPIHKDRARAYPAPTPETCQKMVQLRNLDLALRAIRDADKPQDRSITAAEANVRRIALEPAPCAVRHEEPASYPHPKPLYAGYVKKHDLDQARRHMEDMEKFAADARARYEAMIHA